METILIIDFGGQYNQLIARRVRENNVYSLVKPYTITLDEVKKVNPKGIILKMTNIGDNVWSLLPT